MKTTINICIDVDIAEKLKSEKNVSSLINSYLRNYFMSFDERVESLSLEKLQEKKQEIERGRKEEVENELKIIDEEISKLTQTEEQRKAKEAEKYKSKMETFKDNVRVFCDVGEDEVQRIAEMYDVERYQYSTFFDWCEAKQIKMKKEEEDA